MIYEYPDQQAPIRQGDIFLKIPRIDLSLAKLPVTRGIDITVSDWLSVSINSDPVTAVVAIRPVTAIVITQDCDTVRIDDLALCEIQRFDEIEVNAKSAKYPQKTMSVITKHARLNLKWFYLPPDPRLGFADKMAVDFHSVLRVSRTYLEQNISQLRIGCLGNIASEHFRERLSEYYRRYAYDEWYPLDKKEFEEYRKSKPEPIEPFLWQK